MKKLLGFIALALFVVLPLSVNASIITDFKCGENYQDASGKTLKKCTIKVNATAGESINNYEADLTLTNVTLDESSVKGSGEFQATVLGNTLSFNAPTDQKGETIAIGEFTVVVDTTATECSVVLVPTAAGVEKEPIEVEVTPNNPETGSAISYIAIGAGILLIAGAFVISRKNTKMYKI